MIVAIAAKTRLLRGPAGGTLVTVHRLG